MAMHTIIFIVPQSMYKLAIIIVKYQLVLPTNMLSMRFKVSSLGAMLVFQMIF